MMESIVQWNIGWGYSKKLPILMDMCAGQVPILFLNEGNFETDFHMPGYVTYFEETTTERPKSLATILVRSDLAQSQVKCEKVEGAHLAMVRVALRGKQLVVATLYISPNERVDVQGLTEVLRTARVSILTGDLNAKNVVWGSRVTCRRGRALLNMIENELDMVVINDGSPTFQRNFSSGLVMSCLDVTAVGSELAPQCDLTIEEQPLISDHCRCFIGLKWMVKSPWKASYVTDWKRYGELVDEQCHSETDLTKIIKTAKTRATETVRVPPWAPPPDKRLAELMTCFESKLKSFRKSGLLSDYAQGESIKKEISDHCSELRKKQVNGFAGGLSASTSLSEV